MRIAERGLRIAEFGTALAAAVAAMGNAERGLRIAEFWDGAR